MQQITVASEISRTLRNVQEQVLFCDVSGKALGFFSPFPEGLQASELQLEPPLTIAETEELRKHPTGRPLAEILDRLGL